MAKSIPTKKPKYMLATDLDGTLIGSRKALASFNRQMIKYLNDFLLVYITGRMYASARQIIIKENLIHPDVLVTDVGTEIYTSPGFRPDRAWEKIMASTWDAAETKKIIEDVEGMQPQGIQPMFRLAYHAEKINFKNIVSKLCLKVEMAQLPVKIVPSMGQIIDVIPGTAGKGPALRHIQQLYSIKRESTVACGDSGNDLSMFFEGCKGIIVGNAQPELKDALKSGLQEVYLARSHYASGILEGLKKYGMVRRF
ncbi:MAG: HAD-IIB family hydrolase [Bacillota bacterium]